MRRLAIFLASVVATLIVVGVLDWWMDPFADRYHGDALASALAHRPQCFVSQAVLTPRTWPDFKLDVVRRRSARVVVVGSSRAMKIPARDGELRFANVAVPGTGAETLAPLFRRLHALEPGPLRVYLGTEEFWFTPQGSAHIAFTRSTVRDVKYLLSGQTFRATLTLLRRAPGAIRHPDALRASHVVEIPAGCAVDTGNSILGGAAAAWGADGTGWYRYELLKQPNPHGIPYLVSNGDLYRGRALEPSRLGDLRAALAYARAHRWQVVGFAAPYADATLARLRTSSHTGRVVRTFGPAMHRLYAAYGFPFLDLREVRSVPCDPNGFSNHDGAHVEAPCGRRIRLLLDRAT